MVGRGIVKKVSVFIAIVLVQFSSVSSANFEKAKYLHCKKGKTDTFIDFSYSILGQKSFIPLVKMFHSGLDSSESPYIVTNTTVKVVFPDPLILELFSDNTRYIGKEWFYDEINIRTDGLKALGSIKYGYKNKFGVPAPVEIDYEKCTFHETTPTEMLLTSPEHRLLDAACYGAPHVVKVQLDLDEININAVDARGNTPLLCLMKHVVDPSVNDQTLQELERLLAFPEVLVNQRNEKGQSPLMMATRDPSRLEKILKFKQKIDAFARDKEGLSAIDYSIKFAKLKSVVLLMQHWPALEVTKSYKTKAEFLHWAVWHLDSSGDSVLLRHLIHDPDFNFNESDQYGRAPITELARNPDTSLKILLYLLENATNLDFNKPDKNGKYFIRTLLKRKDFGDEAWGKIRATGKYIDWYIRYEKDETFFTLAKKQNRLSNFIKSFNHFAGFGFIHLENEMTPNSDLTKVAYVEGTKKNTKNIYEISMATAWKEKKKVATIDNGLHYAHYKGRFLDLDNRWLTEFALNKTEVILRHAKFSEANFSRIWTGKISDDMDSGLRFCKTEDKIYFSFKNNKEVELFRFSISKSKLDKVGVLPNIPSSLYCSRHGLLGQDSEYAFNFSYHERSSTLNIFEHPLLAESHFSGANFSDSAIAVHNCHSIETAVFQAKFMNWKGSEIGKVLEDFDGFVFHPSKPNRVISSRYGLHMLNLEDGSTSPLKKQMSERFVTHTTNGGLVFHEGDTVASVPNFGQGTPSDVLWNKDTGFIAWDISEKSYGRLREVAFQHIKSGLTKRHKARELRVRHISKTGTRALIKYPNAIVGQIAVPK